MNDVLPEKIPTSVDKLNGASETNIESSHRQTKWSDTGQDKLKISLLKNEFTVNIKNLE